MSTIRSAAGLLAAVAVLSPILLAAQGSLTPPGPPGPTMKTLDQVEPRVPIGALPFVIAAPGSYYLTANLVATNGQAGIVVRASDVTLDLGGFALIGAAARSGPGIDVPIATRNLAVRNGSVRGWGTNGISAALASNSQFEALRLAGNGGEGLIAGAGSLIRGCVAEANQGNGVAATGGSTVRDCVSTANVGGGISVGPRCFVTGNTCTGNSNEESAPGLSVAGAGSRIENNHLVNNDLGLSVATAGNVIADNTVQGNFENYDLTAGNQVHIRLSEIPQSIPWSATVTLAGSLTGKAGSAGITIDADHVTVDLNGFALIGAPGAIHGISVPAGRRNIAVMNGTVRGWPQYGVAALNASNSQFTRLRVSENGSYGLGIGPSSLTQDCTAYGNGFGIFAGSGGRVFQCTANNNNQVGIRAADGVTISQCTAGANLLEGIQVANRCIVEDNTCQANKNKDQLPFGIGIHVTGMENVIRRNHMSLSPFGLKVEGGENGNGNFIIGNIAANNSLNYAIPDNQATAPIETVGPAGIGTDNPLANLAY